MPRQIVTLEVIITSTVHNDTELNPENYDWEGMVDNWLENNYGYTTVDVLVRQAGPIQQTAEEIQHEIEAG